MVEIIVVVVRVLSAPKVEQLKGRTSLAILQGVVDGLIERAGMLESKVRRGVVLDAWCNEEGLLVNLPQNRLVGHSPIAGDIVISACDASTGETITMDEALTLEAMRWAKSWPMAIPAGLVTRGGQT
jgi:hypothetical protein